jgi:hypothetical protein
MNICISVDQRDKHRNVLKDVTSHILCIIYCHICKRLSSNEREVNIYGKRFMQLQSRKSAERKMLYAVQKSVMIYQLPETDKRRKQESRKNIT